MDRSDSVVSVYKYGAVVMICFLVIASHVTVIALSFVQTFSERTMFVLAIVCAG